MVKEQDIIMDIRKLVRDCIEDNLVVFEEDAHFCDNDNIFQRGIVNSLFAMRLLAYVETTFDIVVTNEEMDISNFSSVDNIVEFVARKQSRG